MASQGVFPARIELLHALDEQIEILIAKTYSGFTADERSEFKNRQQRIRDLEQQVAFAQAQQLNSSGVFARIYE
jgi:hypothetical protein